MTDHRTTPILAQRLSAPNDTNGNPRRIHVSYSATGAIIDIADEGYAGTPDWAVPLSALPTINITPGEYRDWIKRIEHRTGRYAIVESGDGYVWTRRYKRSTAVRYRREHYASERLTIVDTSDQPAEFTTREGDSGQMFLPALEWIDPSGAGRRAYLSFPLDGSIVYLFDDEVYSS